MGTQVVITLGHAARQQNTILRFARAEVIVKKEFFRKSLNRFCSIIQRVVIGRNDIYTAAKGILCLLAACFQRADLVL